MDNPSPDTLPRLLKPGYRLLTAIIVAILTFVLSSPISYVPVRLVLGWNLGSIVLLGLIALMMRRSAPDDTLREAQREETSSILILLVIVMTVTTALAAITYSMNKMTDVSHGMKLFSVYQSIAGVLLAWLLLHTVLSLHYAKLYYNDKGNCETTLRGLTFPGGKGVVDYWDFVYYSFTIAMCFQTSDVTVTSPYLRRLTIFHAIVSYFFALGILGLLLDVISNVL